MSQYVTISTIQSRVLALCDLGTSLDATTPVTADAMLDLLKTSCTLLAGIVREAGGSELYFGASSTLTTTAGVEVISIPESYSDIYRISWQRSSSEELELPRATPERFRAYPSSWSDGGLPPVQRIVGQTIEFFPTPDAAYTIKIYYSTGIYIDATTDAVLCRDGWDQWIALQTCILVRHRQQKAAPEFEVSLGKLEASIRAQLKRDRYGVRQVRDLRGDSFQAVQRERKPW